MTMISSYFAKVAVDTDKGSFARVDKLFDSLEKRINRFANVTKGVQVTVKPRINVAESAKYIQRVMTLAGRDVTIPLRKFTINSKDLASQISNSMATKGGANRIRLNATLSPQSLQAMRQQVQTALSGMIISPRVRPVTSPLNTPRSPANGKPGGSVPSGSSGTSGGFNGLGWIRNGALALLPAFAIGSALSGINSATKTATGSDMTSRGIFTEATQPDGSVRNVYSQSNEWIRNHAYATGTSLPDVLPAYQGFMAASMGSLGYETSQDVFKGFSQFGTVRGASSESMKNALRAVQQMAGKGQIYSEELKGQLSEAPGFGEMMGIFAQAYQNKSGGKLVGSAAIVALEKAMKAGSVKSDLLVDVSKILRVKSDPYITAAANTATGWQNRAETSRFNFTSQFAANGGDKGLATIWQTIAEMTDRAGLSAAKLGGYFQIGSLYASDLLLYMEDFTRVLTNTQEGGGPLEKMFGKETISNIQAAVSGAQALLKTITDFGASSSVMENTKQQWRDISNILVIASNSARQLALLFTGQFQSLWNGEGSRLGNDTNLRTLDLLGIKKYVPAPEMVGTAPTPYSTLPASTFYTPSAAGGNNPSAFVGGGSSPTYNSAPINVYLQNPTITAAPGTSVSQAVGELTSNALQDSLSQSLKGALAKFPKTPQ